MDDLSFKTLSAANAARLPLFRNARGELAHADPDGGGWSLADWMNALVGEVGEAANVLKKVRRGDFTLDEKRAELAKEFADICIYLDILAQAAGVDLGRAVAEKFNEVSDRVNGRVYIDGNEWYVRPAQDVTGAAA